MRRAVAVAFVLAACGGLQHRAQPADEPPDMEAELVCFTSELAAGGRGFTCGDAMDVCERERRAAEVRGDKTSDCKPSKVTSDLASAEDDSG